MRPETNIRTQAPGALPAETLVKDHGSRQYGVIKGSMGEPPFMYAVEFRGEAATVLVDGQCLTAVFSIHTVDHAPGVCGVPIRLV